LAPDFLVTQRNGIIIFIDKLADQETIITAFGRAGLKKIKAGTFS